LKAELEAKRKTTSALHKALLKKIDGHLSPELTKLDETIAALRQRLRTHAVVKENTPSPNAAYHLAFGRAPTERERAAMTAHVERHGLANGCRRPANT
jgi:hypothetical protein